MKGRRLLIGFKENRGNILHVKTLEVVCFGIEHIVPFFEADVTLDVRVIEFQKDTGLLIADIIRYVSEPIPAYTVSEELKNQILSIQSVKFRDINTLKIMKLAAGKRESKLITPVVLTQEVMEDMFLSEIIDVSERKPEVKNESPPIEVPVLPPPLPLKYHKQKITIPIKELRFIFGGVAFDYFFKQKNKNIEIKIFNDVIREEFDAVKNYFRNLLKTKQIQVFIEIAYRGDEIETMEALSPEISRIKREDIESVRFEFINDIRKAKILTDLDKNLFTPEEFCNSFDEMKKATSLFYNDPSALFRDLLGIKDAKHYKHLSYLSSLHAHDMMKLRFVLKPVSFIFLVKGNSRFHFVWETLDTEEATWVWHSGKSREELKRTLAKIEDVINVVKVQGKLAYINTSDDMFRRIIHDYSDIVEGFVKWKYELDSVLL